MERQEILALKLTQLQDVCKKLNLQVSGRKAILQDRLFEYYGIDVEEEEEENEENNGNEVESVEEPQSKTSDKGKEKSQGKDKHIEVNDDISDNMSVMSFREARPMMALPTFTLRDIQESLDYFDGSGHPEVEVWVREFEENAFVVRWDELQKFIYSKQLIKGAALAFIKSQNVCSWQSLKTSLLKEFGKKLSAIEIHKKLEKKKKGTNESLLEYLYSLMAIAKTASLDEQSIIYYFIEGINDNRYAKNMLYEANSIDQLKIKIATYEKIKNRTNTQGMVNHDQTKRIFKKCSNCPQLSNHSTAECKKVSGACFKCNRKGHRAVDCRSKLENKPNTNYDNVTNKQNDPRQNRNNECRPIQRQNQIDNRVQTNVCNSAIRLYKTVQIRNVKFTALLDTGSDVSLITKSVWEALEEIPLLPGKIAINGVGNGKMCTLGQCVVKVKIDEIEFALTFHVVQDEDLMFQSLIGNDVLKTIDISISNNSAKFKLKEDVESLSDIPYDKMLHNKRVESFMAGHVFEDICHGGIFELEDDIYSCLSLNNKDRLANIIQNYKPDKTINSPVHMTITLNDETPIFQRPRRIPQCDQKIVEKQVEVWLKEGIIKESCSNFASPIVLVNKKDGTKRLCCDYRKINERILKDNFPMVLIDEVLAKLQKAKMFSTLDLKNGFFHVPVEEKSQKYTAFVTHHGQFEFLRTPFGMKNSPAAFCRFISHIFHKLIQDGTVIIYMDDIVIPSQNEEENLSKLAKVLEVASKYGLEVNWKKCQFLKEEICFLGYRIKNSEIRPSVEKTEAVSKYKIPNSVKSLQRFVGLTSYFRRFIENYAIKAKPLTSLLCKNSKFVIGDEQRIAFQELKDALVNAPVLKIYNPEAETEVHTDASAIGYGAVLMQKASDDQTFHPVEFMSRQTTPIERNYHSFELEVLAIIQALKKWKCYLLGINFKIVTDCIAFTQTIKKADVPAKIARWVIFLQDYHYTMEHRAATKMKHVDALSRVHSMMIQSSLKHCIIQAQKSDDFISLIRQILEKQEYKDFYVKNDILYKDSVKEQIVVPASMEREIIELAHRQGHFGVKKTSEMVEKNFYIKEVNKKIEQFTKNCIECILANKKNGKKEGFLHPINKADEPLHTFHIDHVGPMEQTKKQYNYILTIVDAFSKFTWIFPTKSTTAEEVIDRLSRVAAIFGNPERIITDRGTAFTANIFKEYCQENNITQHLITTGVPRGNGQVERIHKIIISIISKLSVNNKQLWYKHTDKVMQFINNIPSRSTKISPFTLMTGLKMKIKENVEFKNLIEKELIQELQESREEARAIAKENIEKIQAENKKYYDNKRKVATEYKINDLVAIKRTQFGTSLKLKPKYLGPYKIIKKKSCGRYDVEKVGENEGPIKTSTTAEFMKRWSDSGRI